MNSEEIKSIHTESMCLRLTKDTLLDGTVEFSIYLQAYDGYKFTAGYDKLPAAMNHFLGLEKWLNLPKGTQYVYTPTLP